MNNEVKPKGRLMRIVKILTIVAVVSFCILLGLHIWGRAEPEQYDTFEESTEPTTTCQVGEYVVSEASTKDIARNMLDMENYFGSMQTEYDLFLEGVSTILNNKNAGLVSIGHTPIGVTAVCKNYDLFQDSKTLSTALYNIKNDLQSLCELYDWNVSVRFCDGETQVVDIEIYEGYPIFIPYLQTASLTFDTQEIVYYGDTVYKCLNDEFQDKYDEKTGLWTHFFDVLKDNSANMGFRMECRYDGYAYLYLTLTPFEYAVLEAYIVNANEEYLLTELQRYYIQRGLMSEDIMGSYITGIQ